MFFVANHQPRECGSLPESRVRTLRLIEFALAKTLDREAAWFTCFANNPPKELSFGCMHQSV
jgi:hypothetical protein